MENSFKKELDKHAESKILPPLETRWKPGQSGNPAGWPKGKPRGIGFYLKKIMAEGAEVGEATRKAAKRAGVDVDTAVNSANYGVALARVMVQRGLTGDIPALKEIADRTEGKVPQALDVGGPDGGPIPIRVLSPEELAELKAKILADERVETDEVKQND